MAKTKRKRWDAKRQAELRAISRSTKARIQSEKKRSNVIGLALLAVAIIILGIGGYYAIGYLSSASSTNDSRHQAIATHIHPKLTIRILGQAIVIPANVGIDPNLWHSHAYDSVGMTGMYPIHTHDSSGVIHIESAGGVEFRLGDFFAVWGVAFNSQCIMQYCADATRKLRMFVDGKENFDFEKLVLKDQQNIFIEYS